ncbi:C6 zinc finger protein [Colletotrichum scovillei]|uniref:C6 zinc finger protein n=1 Tax=Colletotrichum scovillei TaxID=1209932 RepID=UPI0015C3A963|nr:C6 zinc finger protein [Colletotrichum scovillei]KAF4779887.1 C6 zinc finger protein [Colletotrichum scovillei]
MTTPVAPAHSNGAASRSSLACLPCRSRHLKCDGKRPHCDRCAAAVKDCQYAPSRRGGLDRAALAERRKRLAVAHSVGNSSSESPTSLPSQQSTDSQIFGQDSLAELNLELNPNWIERLRPLISTMHLVGHIYATRKWSSELQDDVESRLSEPAPNDPVIAQCRLLYSVALFWYSHKSEAKHQMDLAVRLALDLQMFQKEFAATHGAESPVLMECWRRTWWMLYIIDAYYAGTLGTMNFAVVDVDSSVELPCTESEYESGDIPEPQTLEDFDLREFASEDTSYSSFAYLIGAVRCAALAISTTPKLVAREDSMRMIEEADSIIDGWSLLLPEDRRHVMSKTGEIDELMFQAHLLVNVATIGLHRPLSDLRFNPVEDISSCAREPPQENPETELVNVHTVRVLRAVQAQVRLLTLPTERFHHTPFTTCMISEGTLALLSACSFLLKGKELAVARDQIRMTIGCLKTLGQVWPRTAKNVREIQTIAQHVLRLKPRLNGERAATDTAGSLAVTDKGDAANSNFQTNMSSGESEVFASLGTMDDVCRWYNIESIGL